MTHYQVEDVPPDDVDTQVQLFEQAAEVVKDGVQVAQQIRDDAEKILGGIFDAAEKAQDTALANKVNDAWEAVQGLAMVAARQGAALRGGGTAMKTLKKQRDSAVSELDGLKKVLDENDFEHEAVSDFVEALNEMWIEDNEMYYDELAYNEFHDVMRSKVGMTGLELDRFIEILKGEVRISPKQIDLLKQFLADMREGEDDTEAETDEYEFAFDDFEADGDDES